MDFNFSNRERDYQLVPDMSSGTSRPPSYDPAPGGFPPEFKPVPFQRPPFQLHPKKRHVDYWTWEWLTLGVSLLAIISSTIILRVVDNNPIPKWSWSSDGISVNSVLSLLSTLSRASLLVPLDECMGQLMWLSFSAQEHRLADVRVFSEAARGPLGAIAMLWRQRGLTLGCVGSLLLLGSLGIGTAQQQLLSYPSRNITDPDIISTVSRAETFDMYKNLTTPGSSDPTMSFSLLSSIYGAALLSSKRDSTATEVLPFFTCTSGTCIFPDFTTLAICHRCLETTEQVNSTCDNNGNCLAEFQGLTARSWENSNGTYLNTILNQTSIPAGNPSWPFAAHKPFTTFAHLQADSSTTWPPTYTGTQCALYWCIKEVHAEVSNGIYTETVIATHHREVDDANSRAGGISITGPGFNTTFRVTPGAQQSLVGQNGVAATIKGWVSGSASGNERVFSSDLMQGFSSTTNITQVMARVASSMTNRIRDLDVATAPNSGQTMGRETYIRVRWPWLAYPIVLWLLSLTFLLLIGAKSRQEERKSGMRAWGANPLPLIFYGLDDETRSRVKVGEWEQMEDLSERLWVKLEVGKEGLRLTGNRIET